MNLEQAKRRCRILFCAIIIFCLNISHVTAEANRDDALQPIITTSELVVGTNRFAFGLLKSGKFLENADVTLHLYAMDGQQAQHAGDATASYSPIEFSEPPQTVHRHADGTQHVHGTSTDSDVRGIYIAQIPFARSGLWGIELVAHPRNASAETLRFTVTVLETSTTPALGSAAPRSRNLIAADVKDLRQIDTSARPDPSMHQVRIADAIAQKKPQIIVFATPQFCTSRMCGPVVDIVRTLLPTYRKKVAFTHQEIWRDFANKEPFPTVNEWQLSTEPWIFIVDREGIVRAKFEGLVTVRELETALKQTLAGEPIR
jgi:hypothetical protein